MGQASAVNSVAVREAIVADDVPPPPGWSPAIRAGGWVFVSGTTGFDYTRMSIADDAVAQTHQAFANLAAALAQAGATLAEVGTDHRH